MAMESNVSIKGKEERNQKSKEKNKGKNKNHAHAKNITFKGEEKEGKNNFIDDLFENKKIKKIKNVEPITKHHQKSSKDINAKNAKRKGEKIHSFHHHDETPRSSPLENGNFKVYSMNDLNIGKGEDTADCPFDCKCCY